MAEASYPNFDLNNPRDLSKYYSEKTIEEMSDEEELEAVHDILMDSLYEEEEEV